MILRMREPEMTTMISVMSEMNKGIRNQKIHDDDDADDDDDYYKDF